MAADDSDVDISLPTTPMHSSSFLSPLSHTPTQKYKNTQVPHSPGDPFTAVDNYPDINIEGNTSKAIEKASAQLPSHKDMINLSQEDPFEFSGPCHSQISPIKTLTKSTEGVFDEACRI